MYQIKPMDFKIVSEQSGQIILFTEHQLDTVDNLWFGYVPGMKKVKRKFILNIFMVKNLKAD